MKNIETYIESEYPRFEKDFFEFLRIPSISTDPAYKEEVKAAAQWVADLLTRIGLKPELVATQRHPLVYAETPKVPDAPTVMIYGHFDVQPPDPLDQWKTPPFEPTVRGDNVFARGATDDKGQFLTHVFAVEALLKSGEPLPFQIKMIFEGEEEDGSESIEAFVSENTGKLACDCLIVSDSTMFGPGKPAITYGLRGIAAFELFLTGPNHDLHSGIFGGSVYNPAIALSKMLSQLIDEKGRVQIPGFYDKVVPISEREGQQFADLPFDEKEFFEGLGLVTGFGEEGYTTLERRWARPTFDINGLTSGYQGDGSKTVLPSTASAKITFRLVPNQTPDDVYKNLEAFLQKICPPGIKMRLQFQHGSGGLLVPLDSPYVDAAEKALQETFACPPVFVRDGGSIPIIAFMSEKLKADVLLLGWGYDDDNLHAPNEKFSLTSFRHGIHASVRLFRQIAGMKKP
ncbi:MAG: dipeptidase [Planctomycetaceae bacterium]|jgi:succinyl-diaminopimelate desuccinylase|nr:dipeptidase [Planctomycetaceae bacterium]